MIPPPRIALSKWIEKNLVLPESVTAPLPHLSTTWCEASYPVNREPMRKI